MEILAGFLSGSFEGDCIGTQYFNGDVLVIGGGAAGCFAAVTFKEQNLDGC